MSGFGPRYERLLADGDPRPFVLVEVERTPDGYGFSISWGDQIDDDDVPDVLAAAVQAMTPDEQV
jgi:hypothetical protein